MKSFKKFKAPKKSKPFNKIKWKTIKVDEVKILQEFRDNPTSLNFKSYKKKLATRAAMEVIKKIWEMEEHPICNWPTPLWRIPRFEVFLKSCQPARKSIPMKN